MAKGEALFKAQIVGADTAARSLRKASARIDPEITKEFKGRLKTAATEAMQEVAPEDTGLLKDIIEARVSYLRGGIQIIVHSEVRDPDTNYPYTGVTRFGHKKEWITPKHEGRKELEYSHHEGKIAIFKYPHAATLAIHTAKTVHSAGDAIYRTRVKGYKPSVDWVELGMPAADEAVERASERIGRRITTTVLG